ncbi:hypothetical protein [Desulforamulus ruminis]|uniref:Secreted protein n=1 Tax=Desulforamulus ruminis (strain ATCC 23193 / DSM 2154 / NCIMB 8452 / DL) TaxID=696281 RepID=F6DSA0_DESRL|nr:hypothetical protein [Desulforamulus ruminis]AEG59879.1 hypothetical protein Desru_1614 [Desulforamulus ruminis DSM 2154]
MRLIKQKISFLLVVTLLVNLLLPGMSAFAAEITHDSAVIGSNNQKCDTKVELINDVSTAEEEKLDADGEVVIQGKIGYMVKLALQTIRAAVKVADWTGKEISIIFKKLGKDSATIDYFKNNTSKIIKAIDKVINTLDEAQDYVTANIRQLLYDALISANVPGSYALPIADAIAAAVDVLLL